MTFIPKERLKNVRIQRGYKQSEFAERVAMDQSQYSRRETGKVAITDDEWERFAAALGVEKEEIVETEPRVINIVNNSNNKGNSINAFEITIKAPSNFFQDLNNKLDFLIQKIESK
ncbi:MAG: helix-turn-helix transcriptional regulator [Flavobacterium sp.]|uniref:helix-turn-helix domain-containing protein n=1 Tax=Flavobacterium sp. TaxID=239 RepID=UPI0022CABBED|nr:helix-turn-helix transcriptional regulator [Flavobacterium sp.]MCZ8331550.1 helix-turn-helix transcriptional regulator [Flavobacterium sp.]